MSEETTELERSRPRGRMPTTASDVLGFHVLKSLHRDAIILMLCKTVRMFGFGFLSVMVRMFTFFFHRLPLHFSKKKLTLNTPIEANLSFDFFRVACCILERASILPERSRVDVQSHFNWRCCYKHGHDVAS